MSVQNIVRAVRARVILTSQVNALNRLVRHKEFRNLPRVTQQLMRSQIREGGRRIRACNRIIGGR